MWQIKNPEITPSSLDFGSSGRDKARVSQLFAEGIKLINALELVDWNEEDSQFLICEGCGMPGCKSGDWVSVRRSDSLVLFLPAAEHVWREKKDYLEYGPPAYFRQRGIPYLDFATYETLRSQHSSFPVLDKLPPLNAKEAAVLYQWTAPDRILGEPPEVNVQAGLIVGSSEGDQTEPLKLLEDLLRQQYENESSAGLRSKLDNEQVISFRHNRVHRMAGNGVRWFRVSVTGGVEVRCRLRLNSNELLCNEQHRTGCSECIRFL